MTVLATSDISGNGVANRGATRRYAVVVGVRDYSSSGLPSLNYTSNDAEAVYDALLTYCEYTPGDVELYSDSTRTEAKVPSYSDILSSVRGMCQRATDQDSILFVFAGHGTRDGDDSYLLTKEYRQNVLRESSIPMGKINEFYGQSSAKFKMRFFDACHSGRMHRGAIPGPAVASHLLVDAEGWATLAACKEDEFAHELDSIKQGIFSYFMVRGLQGDAPSGSNEITLDNLKVYVLDKTIEFTKMHGIQQTPVFTGEQAGRLVLATKRTVSSPSASLPTTLKVIRDAKEEALIPEPPEGEGVMQEIIEMLDDPAVRNPYVARDDETKKATVDTLTAAVLEWATEWVSARQTELGDKATISVARKRLDSNTILNKEMADKLWGSPIKHALDLRLPMEKVTRTRREPRLGLGTVGGFGDTVEVNYTVDEPEGVYQPSGYADITIELVFRKDVNTIPSCGFVIAVVPCTFGIYAMSYFASSSLGRGTREVWNRRSFSDRLFIPLPVSDDAVGILLNRLKPVCSQFVSFIQENIQGRWLDFDRMGIAPPSQE